MARISPAVLRRYLFGGYLSTDGCLLRHTRQTAQFLYTQRYHTTQAQTSDLSSPLPGLITPFRKQLKDEAKRQKVERSGKKTKGGNQKVDNWELTVGIEIHAQLNTARKLFSAASSTINEKANTHVAYFDLAIPGSQPAFQKETLIPALRAALALNCNIQKVSKFDRKHYFHWDQPAGYQITQYYEPFAKDGYITLYAHDGIAEEDGSQIQIGIKQIQMEQDTAKTMSLLGDMHLLDFNRVGLPLIEIITLPQIHHPSTAAALVRKLQILLNAVDACVLGMESGGLRADVNVSVRRRGTEDSHESSGVRGLGQRTEIKNLSSFKAVEDAIVAERDRQIQVLEAGGVIEGETRGWTIGSTETRRLRGKEGEVDYRYMPDPDIAPVVIGQDLVDHLQATLGVLPEDEVNSLVEDYGLTIKDAMSIVSLDEGRRVEFFRNVVEAYQNLSPGKDMKQVGRFCANWVLHELGGLTHSLADEANPLGMKSRGRCIIPHRELAKMLFYLDTNKITTKTAKQTLSMIYDNELRRRLNMPDDNGFRRRRKTVKEFLDQNGLWFHPLSEEEYCALAESILDEKVVKEILAGKEGKINFLLGQMMRKDTDGRVDPQQAMAVLRKLLDERRELKP